MVPTSTVQEELLSTDLTPESRPTGNRLLLLSEVFPPTNGGSGRWFAELYPRLQQHDVHLLVGEHPEQREVDAGLGVPVTREDLSVAYRGVARLSSLRRYASLASRVRKLAKQHSVEEIHAARPLSEGLVARLVKLRQGIPYTCFVHGEDVSVAKTSRELTMVTRWVLNGARRLIANSSFSRGLLLNQWNIPESKVVMLNPGVDIDYFKPADDCTSIRKSLGWTDRRVLLTVGRLQQRKGQDVAIQAVAQLAKSHPDLLYVIVGGGEERRNLQDAARELGIEDHVSFLGEIADDELLRCYQGCDFFALPNREIQGDVEGFGMVLIEAQACGKPVISGRSGGTLDTLSAGVTGELIDCRDARQFTETLGTWLSSPDIPKRMGSVAREFVAARFSWSALASKADSLFHFQPES